MKRRLCLGMLTLLGIWSAQVMAVNVGSAAYTDDFSSDQYLSDAYSNVGWTRNIVTQQLDGTTSCTIVYAITRTDYSSVGTVQFDATEVSSGNGSWLTFGTGNSEGSIAYGNMTNYFAGANNGGTIRLSLAAGQQTTYLGIKTLFTPQSTLDNLIISDNSSDFFAHASTQLNNGNTAWTMTPSAFMSENYTIVGGTHYTIPTSSWPGLYLTAIGDSITYRFGGNGTTITDGSISFTAHDYACDGSWINVVIYDLAGNQVFESNLRNLGDGSPTSGGSYTLDLATGGQNLASLIGKDGFDVKFYCPYTNGNLVELSALSIDVNAIPEPATMILLGIGSMITLRRRGN